MIFGGIDPGMTGALALIEASGRILRVTDFPTLSTGTKREPDEAALLRELREWTRLGCQLVVYEQQQAMPKQGIVSAFTTGRTEGTVRTALAAAGLAREPVHPRKWKAAMGLTAEKADSRLVALRLYPAAVDALGRRKDEGRAEAILLATYAARRWRAAA